MVDVKRRLFCLATAVAFTVLAGEAGAAEKGGPGLTGDWSGLRPQLAQDGIVFDLNLVFEGAYNPAGGERSRAQQAGQLSLGATGDLDKLLGIPDAKLKLVVTKREGNDLGADAGLNTLQQVQEVYGRGNIWRLTELSYEQGFADDTVDLKFGRVNPGNDFAMFSCDFENLTFCGAAPGNIAGDYWMNSPVSQWGARLKVYIAKGVYMQAGAYQIDRTDQENGRGFTLSAEGGRGTLIPVELGWYPSTKLPGSYKLGGWYKTGHESDPFLDINHRPQAITGDPALQRDGSFGAYVNFQQQVTGADGGDRGLTLFLNGLVADPRTVELDRQFAVGVSYAGPFEVRPQDTVALALGTTHVNGRVADGEAAYNETALTQMPVQRSEYVAELDYRAQATGWLTLDPNLQLIHYPGGDETASDAVVIGLKAALKL